MSEVGRPTVMTEETLNKLEQVFSLGGSDKEACLMAGISTQALYNYQKEHPEYVERKEQLKDLPKYKARKNIIEAIDANNIQVSQWYAERKIKDEFSLRTETTGKDGNDLHVNTSNEIKDLADRLNKLENEGQKEKEE